MKNEKWFKIYEVGFDLWDIELFNGISKSYINSLSTIKLNTATLYLEEEGFEFKGNVLK